MHNSSDSKSGATEQNSKDLFSFLECQDSNFGKNVEAGVSPEFQVAPVSHFWLDRLVEIDSSWNPKHWSVKLFELELSNSFARLKGLFVHNELIGYLIAHVAFDEAHIVSLGVDIRWRRKGGGMHLLNRFMKAAALEGVKVLTLDVRASNVDAQRLYERAGFEPAGIRKKYYSSNGEDAVTMRFELSRSRQLNELSKGQVEK